MSDLKEIKLTGHIGGMQVSKKRKSRKNISGGGSTSAGTIVQLESMSSTLSPTSMNEVEGILPRLASQAAPLLTGGKKRVILKEAPKKINKVTLSVSKIPKVVEHVNLNLPLKNKTRKVSKKIKFSLKHLNKKIHKAKTIRKQSEEKSLDEIKKILSDAKLIKVDSKAPEGMIRQIYSDFMVLKHKAL
uniref:Uncharacterized protein n=1 Tax=viral metagenome TaxID=1070528 RepID=A0A6C0IH65_9ZZZZ